MSERQSIPVPSSSNNSSRYDDRSEQSQVSHQLSSSATLSSSHASPNRDIPVRPPPSPVMGHRQSYAENLRTGPGSPRSQRQLSLSQSVIHDLLNNPPTSKSSNPGITERNWRKVQIGEIIDLGQVKFANFDTSVEEATKILVESEGPSAVVIREPPESNTVAGIFDFSDLNAYLLLVVGIAMPEGGNIAALKEIARKGRDGERVPLRDIQSLNKKEPLITLPQSATLSNAVEVLGSGVHRLLVVDEISKEVIGLLSQLKLVRFFWENGRHFSVLEPLYNLTIRELNLGSQSVVAINGDRQLTDALVLMNEEGLSSLPVLDNQKNVIGNISHVDVKLLTKSSSLPLLSSSCIHFITIILQERGLNEGKDSFPVFHVTPYSTLAHTIAKLVATRSHRMWVVEAASPASSTPSTPAHTSAILCPPPNQPPHTSASLISSSPPTFPSPSISASALPGAALSGHLTGVISLTDILNLFARASGLSPADPDETRRHRRRSSSSSVRASIDSARSSSADVSISRSGSTGGRR